MAKVFIIKSNQEMINLATKMCSAEITQPLKIEVSVHKADRSLSQNRLMWMWYAELRDHLIKTTGGVFTTDDIHDHMTHKFLNPKVTKFMDKTIETYSTKKLSMKDFSSYLEKLDMYFTESYNLILTHPEDLFNEAMGRRAT